MSRGYACLALLLIGYSTQKEWPWPYLSLLAVLGRANPVPRPGSAVELALGETCEHGRTDSANCLLKSGTGSEVMAPLALPLATSSS